MSEKFDKVYNEAIGDTLSSAVGAVKQKTHMPLAKYANVANLGIKGKAPGSKTYSSTGRKELRSAVGQDIKKRVKPVGKAIGKAISKGYRATSNLASGTKKLSNKLGGDPRAGSQSNILGGVGEEKLPPGTEQLGTAIGKFHTNPNQLFTNPQFNQWAQSATEQEKADFLTALITMTKPQ